jgi:hypothetical protein
MWVREPPRPRHLVAYVPSARRAIPRVSTQLNAALLGSLGLATGVTGGLTGAATGAKVGSVAGPIGTAIGAGVGAIAGALLSVLGKQDQEIQNFNQAQQLADSQGPMAVLNIADKYLVLAGLFDLQPGQIKGNIPIYKRYGRMGEQRFVTDMMTRVYQATQAGQITANDTAQSVMTRIVQPWIDQWGYGPMSDHNAAMINMILMGMIAEYTQGLQTRWRARAGDYPFGSLPAFSLPAPITPATPAPASSSGPVQVVAAPPPAVQQVTAVPVITPALIAASNQAGAPVAGGNVVTSSASGGPAPVPTPASSTTTVPVPVTPAGQVDTNALVQQLLAQGQSQQQAYASALASLQAAGVPPTPQAQAAVGQAVQAAGAGGSSLFSGMGGVAIIGALLLASFALARPVGPAPRARTH